ncbi:MAG: hypothetical protein ABI321_15020 [Polyangia bacterium]
MNLPVIGRSADAEIAIGWGGHDVLPSHGWSLAANLDFLRAIVAARSPVYVASAIERCNLVGASGALTLFAVELAALLAVGYERVGDLLVPPDAFGAELVTDPIALLARIRRRVLGGDDRMPEWTATMTYLAILRPSLEGEVSALLDSGVPYAGALRIAHRSVALADEELRAAQPHLPVVFQPKVEAELEPMLALFPDVIVYPTFASLSTRFLVETRVVPIHPLGMIHAARYTDGQLMSPREYFLHDLDHARHMVREDLRSRGSDLADPYQPLDGGPPTTIVDAARGLHRLILAEARGATAGLADELGPRARLARELGAALPTLRAQAVSLLLFEVLHEKGYPADAAVLHRELASTAHVDKLRAKLAAGFYGDELRPDAGVVELLDWARGWIAERA